VTAINLAKMTCKTGDSHSCVAEDSSYLRCHIITNISNNCSAFMFFFDSLTLKIQAL